MNGSRPEPKKLLDFTPDEIKVYLKDLKSLILEDKYTISLNDNREENRKFIEDYKIDSRREKEILLNLEFVSVDIYIKTNKLQTRSGEDFVIIVSFHERNMPIKFLFK